MPTKAGVSTDDLFEVLKNIDIFEENNALKKRANEIWKQVSDQLEENISVANLYLRVTQNRNKLLERLLEYKGITIPVEDVLSTETESSDENYSPIHFSEIKNLIYFEGNIKIEYEIWKNLEPIDVRYQDKGSAKKKRHYEILQPGWADAVYRALWKVKQIPCCFAFKRSKVTKSGVFLKLQGECRECGNVFVGHSVHKPLPECELIISVKTKDTSKVQHSKKRQLKGAARKIAKRDLLHMKPSAWRRDDADKKMIYGDSESADMPNLPVLRKARQEAIDEHLGLRNSSRDPIQYLLELKYDPEFKGTIRDIGLDKVYVFVWSPQQLDLFKEALKKNPHLSVGFDASGGIVKAMKRPDGKTGPIFCYVGVMDIAGSIIPIVCMYSEKHDANFITYWLKEWIRSGAPIPREAVSDMSPALQNAMSVAFNGITYRMYLEVSYQILINLENPLPPCFIRIDIAHLINAVGHWKVFKGKMSRTSDPVKDFYMRCIGFLSIVKDIKMFEEVLFAILVVCQSEYNDAGSETSKQLELLFHKMETFSLSLNPPEKPDARKTDDADNEDTSDTDDLDEMEVDDSKEDEADVSGIDDYFENSDLSVYIDGIKNRAMTVSEPAETGKVVNAYKIPNIQKDILRIAKQFPAWTNVMQDLYGSPNDVSTSARSEAHFDDMKNITLGQNFKCRRLDKVIRKQVRSNRGAVKIARAALENTEKKYPKIESQNKIKIDEKYSRMKEKSCFSNSFIESISQPDEYSEDKEEDVSLQEPRIESSFEKDDSNITSDTESEYSVTADVSLVSEESWKKYNRRKPTKKSKETILRRGKKLPTTKKKETLCKVLNSREIVPEEPKVQPNEKINKLSKISLISDELITSDVSASHMNNSNIMQENYAKVEGEMKLNQLEGANKIQCIDFTDKTISDKEFTVFWEGQNIKQDAFCSIKDSCTLKNSYKDTVNAVKKRGKYLRPCPDVRLLHNRPNTRMQSTVIRNGNHLPPVKISKGKKEQLINTCAADTLTELFLIAYSDSKTYQVYVESIPTSAFLDMVVHFAKDRRLPDLYKSRANLLLTHFPEEKGSINCNSNISSLLKKLLPNAPSLTNLRTCNNCNDRNIQEMTYIDLNLQLHPCQNFATTLQEQLQEHFQNKKVHCHKCKEKTADLEIIPGNHLFLDIEYSIKDIENVTLRQLPTALVIKDRQFTLHGVGVYKPPTIKGGIGHYFAYCRRVSNQWEERNDINEKVLRVDGKNLIKSIKPSFIFYSRI